MGSCDDGAQMYSIEPCRAELRAVQSSVKGGRGVELCTAVHSSRVVSSSAKTSRAVLSANSSRAVDLS